MKIFLPLSFLTLFTLNAFSYVVLVDPGHGGEDTGAKSKGKKAIYEKDLTLKLAKKIQTRLSKNHTVYLTRSIDRTISLMERAEMADKVKADLFISVHINSNHHSISRGFETYYLDNHDNAANKKVENIENQTLLGQDKIINQILIDLVIQNTVNQSKKLAQMIQSNLGSSITGKFSMVSRGVRPGLFYVLALSKRPGVLLEAGFISNPTELLKLQNDTFQEAYAQSVATTIEKYLSVQSNIIPSAISP